MRLFVGIPIVDDARREIIALLGRLRETGWPVRWVNDEGLHLTLKFFGEVTRERLDATDLGRDLRERRCRIRVQLGEPILGGAKLRIGGAQPAPCFVVQRPQLRLGRHLAGHHLTKARDECEIQFPGRTAHERAETDRTSGAASPWWGGHGC